MHIARAEVAKQHLARVQERKRRAKLSAEATDLARRKRSQLPQLAALEQLHRVIGALIVDSVVVDLDHVWMRDLRERVELALEQLERALTAFLVAVVVKAL